MPGAFWVKRVVRIAPMYWLFTALTLAAPFSFGWHPTTLLGRELSFAFLPDVTQPGLVPVLAVGWTLSFEMLFYLLFGACLALPRRAGLAALLLAFPTFLLAEQLLRHTQLGAVWWWPLIGWWARVQILLFGFGVVLGMIHERFGRVVDRRGLGVWGALAAMGAGGPLLLMLGASGSAVAVCLVAALAVTLCTFSAGSRWDRLRPLVRLGDASYVLYLSHAMLVGGLSLVWLRLVGPRAPLAFGLIATAVACGLAWPLHKGLEQPLGRLLRRPLRPEPRVGTPVAAPRT